MLELGDHLQDHLEEIGMQFMGDSRKEHRSGICSFSGKSTDKLYDHLIKQNIIVSLRNGMIRVAPHFYNTQSEIDELILVVKKFYL